MSQHDTPQSTPQWRVVIQLIPPDATRTTAENVYHFPDECDATEAAFHACVVVDEMEEPFRFPEKVGV